MSFKTKKIVIVADDGFYSDLRDRGISNCLGSAGCGVSDVSVLMNGAVANRLLNINSNEWRNNSSLFLHLSKMNILPGLHINLTEGKSVSKPRVIKSLLGSNECFFGKTGFRKKLIRNDSSSIQLNHVEIEIEAQLYRFCQIFGEFPAHVDGHQHIHVLPGINSVIARILSRHGVKWIRLPREIISDTPEVHRISEQNFNFYHQVSEQSLQSKELFVSSGLKFTDAFIGMLLMGPNLTIQMLHHCLSLVKQAEVIEFMTHPGYRVLFNKNNDYLPQNFIEDGCGDPDGPDLFSQSEDREYEMEMLTNQTMRQYFLDNSYELVNFAQL